MNKSNQLPVAYEISYRIKGETGLARQGIIFTSNPDTIKSKIAYSHHLNDPELIVNLLFMIVAEDTVYRIPSFA